MIIRTCLRQLYPMSSRTYSTHLKSFISSSKTFQILNPSSHPLGTESLYILDSSFNPPTKAHLALALSSLATTNNSTILLLLAIQNADKKAKPATFDHRLEMMELLARRIERTSSARAIIALSKHPRFVDKAKEVAIAFPSVEEIVWLVGYDTLIRILDKKYYVPGTVEESLKAFWEKNRLVCAIRGDETVERALVERIRNGDVDGVPVSWAEYIKVIEPVGKEESSTQARKAAADGEWDELGKVVPEDIAEYIKKEQLYTEA
jgi:nicotinamide-nucleotide adenylyltransferase